MEFREEIRKHPMWTEIRAFIEKRGVAIDALRELLYIVSLMAGFLMRRAIREEAKLPVIHSEEEKADESRMEKLGRFLEYECRWLNIEFRDVLSELVYPMAANKALMEPVLRNVYEILDSLVLSDGFREGVEREIDNAEFWGDSLEHYADRKEDYFEVMKKLFSFVLSTARPDATQDMGKTNDDTELEGIRKKYGIDPGDFGKLRRRAVEFFKIAFATHLGFVFQPLREEVDKKIAG